MEQVTLHTLRDMKSRGEPIVMLTAYDYPTALAMDASGIDVVLVGDSLGMVVHGLENTLPVTMDMMVLHCQAVRRGLKRALLVADLPFMSYQISPEQAKANAARLLAKGGADGEARRWGARRPHDARADEIGIAVVGTSA